MVYFLPLPGCSSALPVRRTLRRPAGSGEAKSYIERLCHHRQKPRVHVTRSAPYFAPIDSASLANYLVTSALVTVSDGATTDTLDLSFDPSLPNPLFTRQAYDR
jgi:hypothetical protein